MEKTDQTETRDYEAKAEQRKDNFIARTTAALSGVASGVLSFKIFQKRALRSYLDRRFNNRDWVNGALDEAGRPVEGADITTRVKEIHQNVVDGKAQTLSGAPTTQASLSNLKEQLASGELKVLPGTTVGDIRVNAAYRDLLTNNKSFVDKLVENFGKEADRLRKNYSGIIQSLEKKFFAANTDSVREEIWSEVANINRAYNHTSDMEARIKSIRQLGKDKPNLFKGSVEKFFEEYERAHSNFIDYTHEAKKRHIEIPIFDEMMKPGNDGPGRMGLKLRLIIMSGF
jgi:hypothetical protein